MATFGAVTYISGRIVSATYALNTRRRAVNNCVAIAPIVLGSAIMLLK